MLASQDLSAIFIYLLTGTQVTLEVTAAALVLAVLSAFILATLRVSHNAPLRYLAGFVVEGFRGTSALVQLFWAYYVFPMFGFQLSPFWAATFVLGLNCGSYFSEIVRSSFDAVPRGQKEASVALHLSRWYVFRHVTLPQALPILIPGFGNTLITLLKFTSLASLVTVQELSFRAGQIKSTTGSTAGIYLVTLAIYFLLSVVLGSAARLWERHAAAAAGRGDASRIGTRGKSQIPDWALSK
ncbi:ectoine/hydroxyectoine ABC transporter permease subunit EhuC [Pigmentiphaga soli]|uniref:Ectoine/hydroxyectoine ABC transporter permease subunit EhuC n=1 Tax=Pigmentiphaga soli TaxID=1007095 RepID=A0ABP8GWI5_9BURK